MVIDAILLRFASALSDGDRALLVIPEYFSLKSPMSVKRPFSGSTDYLLARRPSKYAEQILQNPVGMLSRPDLAQMGSSIVLAATTLPEILDGLTQAVLTTASFCEDTNREYGRGIISCGEHWIFFAYRAPDNDEHGYYACIKMLDLGQNAENLDLILGLLRDWIYNADLGDHEYFNLV